MNLITIARLRALQALDAVLSFFDRGLDGAVDAFTQADRKLAAVQAKLDARIAREQDLQVAGYNRQNAVIKAETARRSASFAVTSDLADLRTRAATIQARIGELLK